ncbi:hypothetical protein NKI13_18360 [Mesorhizobium australicum]|uniref:hypothetical protein n=1 Tax=Mesorhizobium australicum TaxID=536018 RepID=UPI003339CF2C
MSINKGDEVVCIKTTGSNSKLELGALYTVKEMRGRYVRLDGLVGSFFTDRFELVTKPKAKPAPFGQVKSVTVNMSDVRDVLTQYVRFGLGINATVEKIIDKFPEAVELVLKHEVTA